MGLIHAVLRLASTDADGLGALRGELYTWRPFDSAEVLEDALDNALSGSGADDLVRRLRGRLAQLAVIGTAALAEERDPRAAVLLGQARALAGAEYPADQPSAVTLLRRSGWIAAELWEFLTATRCLGEGT